MSPADAQELAVRLAVTRLTVFGYIGACGYPHYMLDPGSVEVWVPSRHYLVAREVFENIRCFGERIVIRMDEL